MSLASPFSCVSEVFFLIVLLDFVFSVFSIFSVFSVFSVISRIRFVLDSIFSSFAVIRKSDSLDDESEDGGSDFGSAGTCAFPFHFDNSIGHVRGVGSGGFVPKGIESICDIVMLVVIITIGVESKGGQFVEIFWLPKS